MKLEKWSMIGEIVASSAIVITLAILIVEVRANTSELQAATQDSIAARTQEIALAPVMNPLSHTGTAAWTTRSGKHGRRFW